jgi:hypothetical protein
MTVLDIFSTNKYYAVIIKLLQVTISFLMSVHLSARMEQLISQWREFHEI